MKLKAFLIGVLLIVSSIIPLNFLAYAAPSTAWWDEAYAYRAPILIDNSANAQAMTGYPLMLKVPLLSGMRSDFADLRPVFNQTTVLDYWIEDVVSVPASAFDHWEKYTSNPILTTSSAGFDKDGLGSPQLMRWNSTHFALAYAGFNATVPGTRKDFGYAFSTDAKTWTKYAGNPFFNPNPSGWDNLAVDDPYIFKFNSTHWAMYYCGIPVTGVAKIGVAFSTDRLTWTRYEGNPILRHPTNSHPYWQPRVLKNYNSTHWAMYFATPAYSDPYNNICVAFSTNGLTWTEYSGNPVFRDTGGYLWDNYHVLAPDIIKIDDTFYIHYSGCTSDTKYSSGYATSTNGLTWTRAAANPTLPRSTDATALDSEKVSSPRVFQVNATHYAVVYAGYKTKYQIGIAFAEAKSYAKVWIEPSTIAGNTAYTGSNATHWLYWGNSAASSLSNGTNTFDFFDDFSGTLSKWTTSGTVTVSDDVATVNNNSWMKAGTTTPISWAFPRRLMASWRITAENPAGIAKMSMIKDGSNTAQTYFDSADNRFKYGTAKAGTWSTNIRPNDWTAFKTYQIDWDNTVYWTRSELDRWSTSSNVHTSSSVVIFQNQATSGTGFIVVDWIAVAKYKDPMPTVSLGDITSIRILISISVTSPSTTYADKYTFANVTINHSDGTAYINYFTLEFEGMIKLKWNSIGDVFSIVTDTWGYCTLDASGSSRTNLNSTAVKLTFRYKLDWTYPHTSPDIPSSGTIAYDTNMVTTSISIPDLFTFKKTLAFTNLALSDYRCNPGQTLTASGYWYYEGTSIPPPDGDYQVKVKLSGAQKGSTDTTLVSGAFSISDVAAEGTVGSYSYTIEATYMASTGSFPAIVVDRIKITGMGNDDGRRDVETTGTFWATAVLEYDNHALGSEDSVTISGKSMTWVAGNSRFEATDSKSTVQAVTYNTFTSGNEATYGITAGNMAGYSTTIIWDRIRVLSYAVSDGRANINDNVNIDATLRYEYDNTAITTGTITINGHSSSHIGSGVYRIIRTSASVTFVTYNTVAGSETTHGLSVVNQGGQSTTVIWDRLEFVSITADDIRINVEGSFELRYQIRYDFDDVVFDGSKGSVSGFVWDSVNLWWDRVVTGSPSVTSTNYDETYISITDSTYGLTAKQDVAGVNVITDGLRVSAFSVDISNSHAYVRMLYGYDLFAVSGGTVALAGLQATTNSTGWAVFNLASASNFAYGPTSYGVSDVTYGITYSDLKQTLPVGKATRVYESGVTPSSVTYSGDELVLVFGGSGTLKVAGSRPTYVLNATYAPSDYTTHLSLSHDARKVSVGYVNWGDFDVRGVSSGTVKQMYWTDQKLTLVLNGTSSMSGTLTIYCGSRGIPQSVSGASGSAEYDSTTKILTVPYQFSSEVTITLNFIMPVGGGGGGGAPAITFSVATVKLEAQAGRTVEADLAFTWVGVTQIDLVDVRFGGAAAKWVTLAEALPKRVSKGVGDWEGRGVITIRLMIPGDAQVGEYTLPVTVDAEAVGGRITAGGWVTFNVVQPTPAYSPVPDYMTYLFAALLLSIVAAAYLKSR